MHPNCLSNFRLGHQVHQRVLVLLGLWICLCTTNPIHAWQDDESDRSRRPPSIPKTSPKYDVRPASFKDLTPGQATLQDVTRTLGQAANRVEHQGETTLRYAIDPYSRVEVVIADNVVASIVFYLKEASPRDVLVKNLGLSEFRPTPILDEHGIPLGQAYPERGVLFGFVPGDKKLLVAQIILEPIGAEPFVYRVLHDIGRNYQEQLKDLEQANQLDSKNALSHWLKANILGRIGRQMDALSSARTAARLDPKNLDYKLTLAWLLVDVDRNRALCLYSDRFH